MTTESQSTFREYPLSSQWTKEDPVGHNRSISLAQKKEEVFEKKGESTVMGSTNRDLQTSTDRHEKSPFS